MYQICNDKQVDTVLLPCRHTKCVQTMLFSMLGIVLIFANVLLILFRGLHLASPYFFYYSYVHVSLLIEKCINIINDFRTCFI